MYPRGSIYDGDDLEGNRFRYLRRLEVQDRVAYHLKVLAAHGLDVDLDEALALMIARREDILRAFCKVFEIRCGFFHDGFRLALMQIVFVLRERGAEPAVRRECASALMRNVLKFLLTPFNYP